MPELHEQFAEFFTELWGFPPFAWQSALAARVASPDGNGWPDVIALPTAAGKTACIDIAIFALAAHARRLGVAAPLPVPRRLFFVVDRRVIVSEAFERAQRIAKRLDGATSGVLEEVATLLRGLARGDLHGRDPVPSDQEGHEPSIERDGTHGRDPVRGLPLAVFQLRGGIPRTSVWAYSPLQPVVVVSTVDQVGSRLLFRGYGHSPYAWPLYAGLIANDSVIVLDEAHTAEPFLQTVQAVTRYREWAQTKVGGPFRLVVMSATPPEASADIFHDDSPERFLPDHPLGQRLTASKPAALLLVKNASGKHLRTRLADALVAAAEELAAGTPKAVVIFCNRVATARQVYRTLFEKHRERASLLTGRMRPLDKDDVVHRRLRLLMSSVSRDRVLGESVFVVATQTLEVGADLDFDALVTECASLDALRQRFGRLNRMGRSIDGRAAILMAAGNVKEDDDPVYGHGLSRTWAWLQTIAVTGDRGRLFVDFGVNALDRQLLHSPPVEPLTSEPRKAPVMLPAHVDLLSQTSPVPAYSPDVALFLHGRQAGAADVQVCWRADLFAEHDNPADAVLDLLTRVPPHPAECVAVPIGTFKAWLRGEQAVDDTPDVEGIAVDMEDEGGEKELPWVFRWRGPKRSGVLASADDVRPGDIFVLRADEPGWEALGDLARPIFGPPRFDRADEVIGAQTVRLRLHPDVLSSWPATPAREHLKKLVENGETRYIEDLTGFRGDLIALLHEMAEQIEHASADEDDEAFAWLAKRARQFSVGTSRLIEHPVKGYILEGPVRPSVESAAVRRSLALHIDSFVDDDDAASSSRAQVELATHLRDVARLAERFAGAAGLDAQTIRAVVTAARLHDIGKADPRFQALLNNGVPWFGERLLAKSERLSSAQTAFERARATSGYPREGRHELLSVRLLESQPVLLPETPILRDLVLHLVAAHHGRCRSFAPVVFDEAPQDVSLAWETHTLTASSRTGLERVDSGVSERYWRLVRQFGWWGLAWLEGLVRLADHRASELEEVRAARTKARTASAQDGEPLAEGARAHA